MLRFHTQTYICIFTGIQFSHTSTRSKRRKKNNVTHSSKRKLLTFKPERASERECETKISHPSEEKKI